MCCTSLLKLWANGDLAEVGDGRLSNGVILADGEVEWAEKVKRELLGGSATAEPERFDGEGKIRFREFI